MSLVVPPRSVLITSDTTRGNSAKKVKRGTIVNVIATRLDDDDGLKLLVRIGEGGRPFQVEAKVTSWGMSSQDVRYFCNDPRHETPCPLPCVACEEECEK